MKFFADTADIDDIRALADSGLLDGVTTNPSLIKKSGRDFVEVVRELPGGRGADVVLDNMGAAYLARNVDVLAVGGRLVVIGLQGGARREPVLLLRLGQVRELRDLGNPDDLHVEEAAADGGVGRVERGVARVDRVQRRRQAATMLTQRVQVLAQDRMIAVTRTPPGVSLVPPAPVRALLRGPVARLVPRVFVYGLRPEHVTVR